MFPLDQSHAYKSAVNISAAAGCVKPGFVLQFNVGMQCRRALVRLRAPETHYVQDS